VVLVFHFQCGDCALDLGLVVGVLLLLLLLLLLSVLVLTVIISSVGMFLWLFTVTACPWFPRTPALGGATVTACACCAATTTGRTSPLTV
jgi:hypothetical protein